MTVAADEARRDELGRPPELGHSELRRPADRVRRRPAGPVSAPGAAGPSTAAELATGGIDPRYAREWLEQQAVNGVLDVLDASAAADQRRFVLPAGHDEVLLDRDSLSYMAPLTRLMVSTAHALPKVIEAIRTGGGVAGPTTASTRARARPMAIDRSTSSCSAASGCRPFQRSTRDCERRPPARVADFGCGPAGAASPSRAPTRGRRSTASTSTRRRSSSRVRTLRPRASPIASGSTSATPADPASPGVRPGHRCSRRCTTCRDPVEALRVMRGMLAPGGAVLVVDEKVAEQFAAPGDDVERLMYGSAYVLPARRPVGARPRPAPVP